MKSLTSHLRALCFRLSLAAALSASTAAPGLAQASPCTSATCISGPVVNTTWPLSGSPYCINGSVQILNLTIDPGVEVQLCAGVDLQVNFGFVAVGTADQPIRFVAQDPINPWAGISFNGAGSTSILRHCQFENASDSAITIVNSAPTIDHCVFTGNTNLLTSPTPAEGGAIRIVNNGMSVSITRCTFKSNMALNGGAINATMTGGALLDLMDCVIQGNSVNPAGLGGGYVGGGVFAYGSSNIENCLIESNTSYAVCSGNFCSASAGGGGLELQPQASDTATLRNCVIRSNSARGFCSGAFCGGQAFGGGLSIRGPGASRMDDCVVGCNLTDANTSLLGSGLYVDATTLNAANCTFARNSNWGVYQGSGTVNLTDCILYFNNPTTPPTYGPQYQGTVSLASCDLQGLALPWTNGNFDLNPAFSGTGCDNCDLTILLGSPCADQGEQGMPPGTNDDYRLPPGQGQPTNDVGAHGGLHNARWNEVSWSSPQAEGFCSGDGSLATPCPCSDTGARGRGCANSVYYSGALLLAVGNTSPDTMVLQGSCMPNATTSIYLKGDQFMAGGLTFGDGIRCVDGFLIRLSAKQTVNGASQFPGPGNATLSLKGQTPPGSGLTAYYQCYYRNASAAYCPPATFNITNGIRLVW